MELSAETFEEIAKALGACPEKSPAPTQPTDDAATPEPAEQRGAGRVAVSAEVLIAPYGVARPQCQKVTLRSLSRGGAAVLDPLVRQPGQRVVLHLPKRAGQTIPLVCMVMNTRLTHTGEFRLGLQFRGRAENLGAAVAPTPHGVVAVTPGAAAQTNVLEQIAAAAAGGARLSRTAGAGTRDERVELGTQALFCEYDDGRTGQMYFVTVKDISLSGGVCVIQPELLQPGQQFLLQIPRERGKPLMLLCTTVDSRRGDDGQYRVGARFQLHLFGQPGGGPTGLFTRVRRWFAA